MLQNPISGVVFLMMAIRTRTTPNVPFRLCTCDGVARKGVFPGGLCKSCLGVLGGSRSTAAKARAARRNGMLGGRPRKHSRLSKWQQEALLRVFRSRIRAGSSIPVFPAMVFSGWCQCDGHRMCRACCGSSRSPAKQAASRRNGRLRLECGSQG